jgi:hypothetical protein
MITPPCYAIAIPRAAERYHPAMSRREDDRLIREMLAPDVEESLDALSYWLQRHDRLPFYRRSARGEARRMIAYWQGRAVSDATRSPIDTLLNARTAVAVSGQLVAHKAHLAVRRSAITVGALGALIIVLIAR